MPLYIGKAATFGKSGANLSANLKSLETDQSKFARWGSNYAYHVSDLSACVLPGHHSDKRTWKYTRWADQLFENAPSDNPRLQHPVFFWAMAWDSSMAGLWEKLGPTSLAFLDYLMIGVAGLFAEDLLNHEGIARVSSKTSDATPSSSFTH